MALFKKKSLKPSPANGVEGDVSQKTELEKDGEKHFEREPAPSGFQNFFVGFILGVQCLEHPLILISEYYRSVQNSTTF
jgi:hypothetical protein